MSPKLRKLIWKGTVLTQWANCCQSLKSLKAIRLEHRTSSTITAMHGTNLLGLWLFTLSCAELPEAHAFAIQIDTALFWTFLNIEFIWISISLVCFCSSIIFCSLTIWANLNVFAFSTCHLMQITGAVWPRVVPVSIIRFEQQRKNGNKLCKTCKKIKNCGVLMVGVKAGVDQGAPSGFRHFCCKFSHKTALATCPCPFRLPRLAQSLCGEFCLLLGSGTFRENSRVKWLLWHVHVHFNRTGTRKVWAPVLFFA